MATFTPYGTVWIGRVPFDNSYKHVMSHASMSAQKEYFKSVCNRAFDRAHYTYIRKGQSIKVPFNAEELYSYNYLMYQNANFGTKWFYCFITDVVYINDNTTELILELDIWNTWYFNWTRGQCFVEREHVNDDTIGAHTNPEPDMPMVQVSVDNYKYKFDGDWAAIIQRSNEPVAVEGGSWLRPDEGPILKSVPGGVYQGVYSGLQYYYVRIDHNNPGPGVATVNSAINRLTEAGGGDAIANIYMVPNQFVQGHPENSGELQNSPKGYVRLPTTIDVSRPTSLGSGYVPRNNKLFTYPYTFLRLYDNNGSCQELAWELWDDARLRMVGSMEPSGDCFVYPVNYCNIEQNVNAGITTSLGVQCAWTYSAYKNWVAQNQIGNALKFGVNAAMFIFPVAKGISAAAKGLGMGIRAAGKLASAGYGKAAREAVGLGVGQAGRNAVSSVGTAEAVSMGAGAMGLANQVADFDRMSRQPNVTKGSATGNSMYALNLNFWSYDKMAPRYEYCQIIDGFFDMYGYQVDRVKVPNITGRQSWNYVKTSNACFRGTGGVPAQDMAAINAMLDSGITIWHTSDIGNYSLPNGIV